jgi:hypothetical protein
MSLPVKRYPIGPATVGETPAAPTAPVTPEPVVPTADGSYRGVPGGKYIGVIVTGGMAIGLAEDETLPGAIVEGTIVGLIIVIGPAPPPLTQPDIVMVPIADEPYVGGKIGLAICA